jgi:hypothetical protein
MPEVCLVNLSLNLQFLFIQDELVAFLRADALDKMIFPKELSTLSWTNYILFFFWLLVGDVFFGVVGTALVSTERISLTEGHGIQIG